MCTITEPDDPRDQIQPRGTLIQTTPTDRGSQILTMPTDQGSRIVSRDEYNRLNTPQGRTQREANYGIGLGREQEAARQAVASGIQRIDPFTRQETIPLTDTNVEQISNNLDQGERAAQMFRETGPSLGRSYIGTPMTPIPNPRRGIGSLGEAPHGDIYKQVPKRLALSTPVKALQSQQQTIPLTDTEKINLSNQLAKSVSTLRDRQVSPDEYNLPNRISNLAGKNLADAWWPTPKPAYENIGQLYDVTNTEEERAILPRIGEEFYVEPDFSERVAHPFSSQVIADEKLNNDPFTRQNFIYPQGGNWGAKVDTDNALFDLVGGDSGISSLRQQRDNMYYPVPQSGDYVVGEEGGLGTEPTAPTWESKGMSPMVAKIAKMQGFDVDNPAGYRDYLAATGRSDQAYREGQIERQRDADRAARMAATQNFTGCPEGYVFNPTTQTCEKVPTEEEKTEIGKKFVRNTQDFPDLSNYGRVGGEYSYFTEMPGVAAPVTYNQGGGGVRNLPRMPQGETYGRIKEDTIGPVYMSGSEYVLPTEQIIEMGNGDYNRGIQLLDNQRHMALEKYKDKVDKLIA